jgi:hypothetical protein
MGGYNSNRFDIPMLIEEFSRAGLDFSTDGRKNGRRAKNISSDGTTHIKCCLQILL